MRPVDVLSNLRAALDALSEVDFAGLDAAGKLDALRELTPLVWRLAAQESQLVAAVHQSGAVNADGYNSTVGWMRGLLRVGDAGVQVRSAMALGRTPAVREAYERGECGPEHVAALATVVRDISDEVLAAGADKLLAEQAGLSDPKA